MSGIAAALLAPCAAVGEIGPALTGLTGRANDATSAFFSSTGITRLDRPELVAQATVMYQESKFNVQQASFGGGDSDKDSRVFTIPAAYYVHPLGERWRLGLSVTVPSGIGHDYGKKWSGRYLSEDSELAFVAASTVLAYRLTDHLVAGCRPLPDVHRLEDQGPGQQPATGLWRRYGAAGGGRGCIRLHDRGNV
jgi:long-chain fatty acid transport protein